ncbi:hypothetical protein THAOC_16952, partial [Thalassiosira oceanica]
MPQPNSSREEESSLVKSNELGTRQHSRLTSEEYDEQTVDNTPNLFDPAPKAHKCFPPANVLRKNSSFIQRGYKSTQLWYFGSFVSASPGTDADTDIFLDQLTTSSGSAIRARSFRLARSTINHQPPVSVSKFHRVLPPAADVSGRRLGRRTRPVGQSLAGARSQTRQGRRRSGRGGVPTSDPDDKISTRFNDNKIYSTQALPVREGSAGTPSSAAGARPDGGRTRGTPNGGGVLQAGRGMAPGGEPSGRGPELPRLPPSRASPSPFEPSPGKAAASPGDHWERPSRGRLRRAVRRAGRPPREAGRERRDAGAHYSGRSVRRD